MERTRTMSFMCLAILGRCSLILMLGTAVEISLKGPPLTVPGFKSNVSIWLGPPFIHRRMHERRRWGLLAAAAARFSSQPDMEKLTTPADVRVSHSRREREGVRVMVDAPLGGKPGGCPWLGVFPLMVKDELAAVEDRPEHIGQGIVLGGGGPGRVCRLG